MQYALQKNEITFWSETAAALIPHKICQILQQSVHIYGNGAQLTVDLSQEQCCCTQ